MRIEAPYPEISAIIILPEPLLRNKETFLDEREYLVMMDKSVHSNVKRTDSVQYTYDFYLTREKMLELSEFIRRYSGKQWRWYDHHDFVHIGYCLTNPSEGTVTHGPDAVCGEAGYSPNEKVNFRLVLET